MKKIFITISMVLGLVSYNANAQINKAEVASEVIEHPIFDPVVYEIYEEAVMAEFSYNEARLEALKTLALAEKHRVSVAVFEAKREEAIERCKAYNSVLRKLYNRLWIVDDNKPMGVKLHITIRHTEYGEGVVEAAHLYLIDKYGNQIICDHKENGEESFLVYDHMNKLFNNLKRDLLGTLTKIEF